MCGFRKIKKDARRIVTDLADYVERPYMAKPDPTRPAQIGATSTTFDAAWSQRPTASPTGF
jgi:hypothetical protein